MFGARKLLSSYHKHKHYKNVCMWVFVNSHRNKNKSRDSRNETS